MQASKEYGNQLNSIPMTGSKSHFISQNYQSLGPCCSEDGSQMRDTSTPTTHLQYCTLDSSPATSCNTAVYNSPSTLSASPTSESPISLQDYQLDNTYGSPVSVSCITEDPNDLQHKLRELENAMLGPDSDNPVDSIQSNLSLDPENWMQMMGITCGDLNQALLACACAVAENNFSLAEWLITQLRPMVSVSGDPTQRLGAYMLEGLIARLASSGSSIYKALRCKEPVSSDLLSYMHLLYEACPYFKFGYLSANGAIAEAFKCESRVHIIDFQIAQGTQWVTLIQALAKRPGGPPRLRITGIDDSVSAYARATGSSTSSDPVTAPPPSASSQPPKSPFLRSSNPPIFIGKPVNPPPQYNPGGAGAAPFHPPVGPARAFPLRSASDRVVTVANPAGYIRNSSATAVMSLQAQAQSQAHAQAQAQAQAQAHAKARPFVFAGATAGAGTGDPAGQKQQNPQQIAGAHSMRPPHQHQHQQYVVSRQQQQLGQRGPPRSGPVAQAAQQKVAQVPIVSSAPEINSNDGDQGREDPIMVIYDRKVRLSEGGSGSLYALCRSWVRNGLPQENQPMIGDSLKILPRPLPASLVNSQLLKKSENPNVAENFDKEEDLGSTEKLSARDLLKSHVNRAKKVRARLRKERLLRIERYKQRLSLLLPHTR